MAEAMRLASGICVTGMKHWGRLGLCSSGTVCPRGSSSTGIFAPGMGKGQLVTLILQGHGNNCTSPDMATHWTLVVHGPKAEYHLFGKFVQ